MLSTLAVKNKSRILLVVLDGLGGIAREKDTELEEAYTPHLDRLAEESSCGLMDPVFPGITPGSGPAHLALFGYDPLKYDVGRGVLSALGIDFPLQKGDVAARVNFATMDKEGRIVDRRAGRIPTELNQKLCDKLNERIKIPGVEIFFTPEKEHRASLVIRGKDLSEKISDTDPQKEGLPPLPPRPLEEKATKTAEIVGEIIRQVKEVLAGEERANMVLLRGFSSLPEIPSFSQLYKMRSACIAVYPMYRGVARLAGMEILKCGETLKEEIQTLRRNFQDYDFFFLHYKPTDSAGEDGARERKIKFIEEFDRNLPSILSLEPDVLCITGDHSTPSPLRSHSWHPVPVLIYARTAFRDRVKNFSETECIHGILGKFPSLYLMSLLLAHAGRLKKFGA